VAELLDDVPGQRVAGVDLELHPPESLIVGPMADRGPDRRHPRQEVEQLGERTIIHSLHAIAGASVRVPVLSTASNA